MFITDSQRIKANDAVERAVALDEKTGRVLWTQEWRTNYSGLMLVYAIGPRATPTVDGDRVYVLGTMGNLLALDVATGRILWQKDYVKDFNASVPTWGMSGAPLVDGDLLICLVGGEPDGEDVALDKLTGDEVWRSLSSDSEPGYNQPIIIEAGGTRQLIIFHADGFASLDPKTRQGVLGVRCTASRWGLSSRRRCTAAPICSSPRNGAARACCGWTTRSRPPRCCGADRANRIPA